MKTLIFNGSPRKNGDTMTLINEFARSASGQVTTINAYDAKISPCIDCRACKTENACSIDDEMTSVYHEIEESDVIVIASPIYFSELTAPLLSVMSRLQKYFCARFFRGETPILKEKQV